ncbi:Coenzyme Q-binding protein COQ10-like protein, mitochondrial [Psilocybe cubensis]|uniref:Coenzyme Q-binding protein COQ10-like protein, mitochondrial n=2 Tax=Psilocybe cubensis TaxID=181762 RepID=A0ACB8H4Z6_PSICU|nr:Coenzyme Q-binding protein COQ10-like protein, mitochondrial [Psilocybe cubensis]KAH9482284.1 Coenzyme Q-binding protein COQ10-like protein, mitochondrial [Psilocybe cubensis]
MLLSPAPLRPLLRIPSLRRTLFSLPSFPFGGLESKPQNYNEQKIFPYNAKELYAVVADVASYPQFIPFCVSSRIDRSALERAMKGRTVVDAELAVGFLNFKESYVSEVTCVPFESVQARASSSTPLFKSLLTTWRFQNPTSKLCSVSQSSSASAESTSIERDNSSSPTLVTFDLTYEFANPLHAGVSATFFGQVSKMMIQAFEDRCVEVYGRRNSS